MTENKAMLWGAIFSSGINLAAYVVFWNVITTQVPVLTGAGIAVWGRGELTVLIGMTEVAWGLGAFLWMGTWQLPWYVTEEGLETFLVRPVSIACAKIDTPPPYSYSRMNLNDEGARFA